MITIKYQARSESFRILSELLSDVMESCGLRLRRHFDDEWSTRIVRMKGYQYKHKCRRRRRSGGRSVQLVLLDSPQQQERDEASSRYSSQVHAVVCLLVHHHFFGCIQHVAQSLEVS